MAEYYCMACGSYFNFKLPSGIKKNKKAKISIALSMVQNGTLEPSAIKYNKNGYVISVSLHYTKIKPHCPRCLNNKNVVHISQLES